MELFYTVGDNTSTRPNKTPSTKNGLHIFESLAKYIPYVLVGCQCYWLPPSI